MAVATVKRGRGRPPAEHDRKVTRDGYVLIRTEVGKWEYEHRIVMARVLGRPLARREPIRWLNGDRSDNRPENLELDDACPNCGFRLAASRHMREIQGAGTGKRTSRRRRVAERLGQVRLWRGAP